jgi:hypothetical protein
LAEGRNYLDPARQTAEAVMMTGEPDDTSIDPNEQLWRDIEKSDGDGSAALAVLAAGHPIYYVENDTPAPLLIKEYPDGRRELVCFHREGDEVMPEPNPHDAAPPYLIDPVSHEV